MAHKYTAHEFFYDTSFSDYDYEKILKLNDVIFWSVGANINRRIYNRTVFAETRHVNATLTRENVEDIRNMHGIDAAAAFERILAEELNKAIVEELQTYDLVNDPGFVGGNEL